MLPRHHGAAHLVAGAQSEVRLDWLHAILLLPGDPSGGHADDKDLAVHDLRGRGDLFSRRWN